MDNQRVHITVDGRVQGVGFRYQCRHEAKKLGLTGWVRNLDDGRVEVLAEGPSKRDASRLTGRDRSGRLVHFLGEATQAGTYVGGRIERATGLSFSGIAPAAMKES